MLNRLLRSVCALLLATSFPLCAELGEDGLHKQPWFSITFKDVAEDMAEARDQGKRLALIVEQQGCIYCERLHATVLNDPAVSDYIAEHFVVVQYNLFGNEEVTDLDGEVLTERDAASKWGVMFTPTILFLPESADADNAVGDVAEAALPGAFGKWTTLHMFQYVFEDTARSGEHFQRYHARKLQAAREAGLLSESSQ